MSVVDDIVLVEQIWWYASRAAGIVAWVLLSISLVAGMALPRGGGRLPAGWTLDLHRFTSTLAIVFLSAHMVLLIPDEFVDFGARELLVPMASSWNPAAVAWGVVAFWLVVCVEVSSRLRSRLPRRWWKTIHFSSLIAWPMATVHLFQAGTDASHPLFRGVQVVLIGAVLATFIARVRRARTPGRATRATHATCATRADHATHAERWSAGSGTLPVEEPVHVDEVDAGERGELATRRR